MPKSANHPFGDEITPDANEYLSWIRAWRAPSMSKAAERCHAHLQDCPDCLRRFLTRLADPDTENYAAEMAYLFELSEILDEETSAATAGE